MTLVGGGTIYVLTIKHPRQQRENPFLGNDLYAYTSATLTTNLGKSRGAGGSLSAPARVVVGVSTCFLMALDHAAAAANF